jgi:hypothetical protein
VRRYPRPGIQVRKKGGSEREKGVKSSGNRLQTGFMALEVGLRAELERSWDEERPQTTRIVRIDPRHL